MIRLSQTPTVTPDSGKDMPFSRGKHYVLQYPVFIYTQKMIKYQRETGKLNSTEKKIQ